MSFGNIGEYLAKFRNLTAPNGFVREKTVAVIVREFGFTLDKNAVRVSKNTVFIQAPSALKGELYLKKDKILSLLRQEGVTGISEIR